MSLSVQAYRPSHIGGITDNLSAGFSGMNKDKGIGGANGPSAARRWLEMQQQQVNHQSVEDGQSFFDFEPSIESDSFFASQYPSLPEADLTPGWNAIAPRVPSPPESAASPPTSWPPFPYQQPAVHNILTDIYPDTRVRYGQTTPPDDECPNLFTALEQSPESQNSSHVSLPAGENKRKRQSISSDDKTTPLKRSRKNGRSARSNGQGTSGVEDVRRNKFLERNRIAASKCRQKKKEWTQNLETRARELHKENNSLRLLVDSLREEILFIKGELLKHTTCGCDQIQGWLKSSAGSHNTSPIIKAEHSPINSAPASRQGSVSTVEDGSQEHEPTSSHPDPLPADSQNLESLLMTQLVHDTSNEGIASTLLRTAQ